MPRDHRQRRRAALRRRGTGHAGRLLARRLDELSVLREAARVLRRTASLMALDLRGHGRSEHVDHGHVLPSTGATFARSWRPWAGDAVVVGWSMGAMVAWEMIDQFGTDGLRALVVVGQSPSDFKWPDWPEGFLDFDALRHVMESVQADQAATARDLVGLMLAQTPPEDEAACMVKEISRPPASVASAILFDQTVATTARCCRRSMFHRSSSVAATTSSFRCRRPSWSQRRCRRPSSSSSKRAATVRFSRSPCASTRSWTGSSARSPRHLSEVAAGGQAARGQNGCQLVASACSRSAQRSSTCSITDAQGGVSFEGGMPAVAPPTRGSAAP